MSDQPFNEQDFFETEEFDEEAFEAEELFMAELDDAMEQKLAGTKWEPRLQTMDIDSPWEDRIKLYQEFRAEEVFPTEATYFLVAWAIEGLIQERIDDLYDSTYAGRFEKIRTAHGLAPDEDWDPGEGPEEYEALSTEFGQAAQALGRATYQAFGEHQMLELQEQDPEEARRRFEVGGAFIEEIIDESLKGAPGEGVE